MPDRFLEGRGAWVTGGATGMGRAIAIALAKAGADMAIGSLPASGKLPDAAYAARPDLGEIEAAAETIRALGVKCFAQALDVREDASVDDFQHTAAKMLGGIDILINAAGVSAQEAMTTHRDETWTTVLDINLNGCYRTIRRCFPSMLKRRW